MIELTLHEIAAVTRGQLVATGDDELRTVDAIATDSRTVPSGRPMFVALATDTGDGHDHVAGAVAGGAVAVLAERTSDGVAVPTVVVADTWLALRELAQAVRARIAPRSVAITGSVGKTTVKDLTAAAAAAERRTHAARGSFNNELGVPLTLLGMAADTEVLVAELGARKRGDLTALAGLVAPDIAVVTAVVEAHVGIFGSIEEIALAKGELVEALGPDGVAVLHLADPRVAAMTKLAPRSITVAIDLVEADVHARDVTLDGRARPRAVAVTPWGEVALSLPVSGRHQLVNGLFALAVAGELGIDLEAAAAAIAEARVSGSRGAVVDRGGITVLDDSYNANPTAVRAALDTLVAIAGNGSRVAVLGRMAELGASAAEAHRRIGERCAALSLDHLVVVGDPGDTDGEVSHLAQGARDAGLMAVTEVPDAAAAGALLAGLVTSGDVVLVKASRIAGLERVVAALLEPVGEVRA
ncbi:MAG: UDP-N-acetylmuramoyl-tripeptide--D-alanyl-D-alanine ligase [Nitriliruptoraceae bacterium]